VKEDEVEEEEQKDYEYMQDTGGKARRKDTSRKTCT
jgi:hypothetical protein